MIYSIGCDICCVKRIEKSAENPLFLKKHFSERENGYFASKKHPNEHIAGAFAAKEAFAKSLGTGFRGFSFIDVEILHNENGAPYIELSEKCAKIVSDLGIDRFHLTISHEKDYAVAFVVAEKL